MLKKTILFLSILALCSFVNANGILQMHDEILSQIKGNLPKPNSIRYSNWGVIFDEQIRKNFEAKIKDSYNYDYMYITDYQSLRNSTDYHEVDNEYLYNAGIISEKKIDASCDYNKSYTIVWKEGEYQRDMYGWVFNYELPNNMMTTEPAKYRYISVGSLVKVYLGTVARTNITKAPITALSVTSKGSRKFQLSINTTDGHTGFMLTDCFIDWGDNTGEPAIQTADVTYTGTNNTATIYPTKYPYKKDEFVNIDNVGYRYNSSGGVIEHTYEKPGIYTIIVTTKSIDGKATKKSTISVSIDDIQPQISVNFPEPTVTDLAQVPHIFKITDLKKGEIKEYQMLVTKINADGTNGEILVNQNYPIYVNEFYHNFSQSGKYRVSFTAIGYVKKSVVHSQVYTIKDQAPEIFLALNQNTSNTPVKVTVIPSNSGGAVKEWIWDWDDGVVETTTEAPHSHTFTKRGTYTITVTAKGEYYSHSAVTEVTVIDPVPLISVLHANNKVRDRSSEPVQFAINNDGNSAIKEIVVNVVSPEKGAETMSYPGDTEYIDYVFDTKGTYNVWFDAYGYDYVNPIDPQSGLRSFSTTPVTYTIKEIAPVTTLTVEQDRENAPVTVTATPSNSGGSVDKWEWNWGDETVETVTTAAAQVHTYKKKGTYTITVKAIGPDYSHSSSQTIEVKMNDMTPINMLLLD